MAENTAIEVVLKRSGLTFIVPPDKSILEVLIEEAIDPMYDCQRGECGICQVAVPGRRSPITATTFSVRPSAPETR